MEVAGRGGLGNRLPVGTLIGSLGLAHSFQLAQIAGIFELFGLFGRL
jgi:hypothetical protein